MKILITTDWYEPIINGVVTSVLTLKTELEKAGHEVRVVTLSGTVHSFKIDHVYYMGSLNAGKIYPGARWMYRGSREFLEEILDWSPDVVHSQCEFSTFLTARRIADTLAIPLIHTYHTVYEDYTHYFSPVKPWGRTAVIRFTRFILGKTDAVIAPTGKVKQLLSGYGIDRPVSVVPTGINLARFLPNDWQEVEQDRKAVRDAYGITGEQKVLLVLGRIAKEKNIDEIVDYFERMDREDMVLLIAGDGPYREELEKKASRSVSSSRILFTGMVKPEETVRYYRAGDVFVSASQSETQGITYLEALSSGLPVLCREDLCVKGIVRNGENGYMYREFCEFELYCQQVLAAGTWYGMLSAEAVRTGMKYGSEAFAAKAADVYTQAIREKRHCALNIPGESPVCETAGFLHLGLQPVSRANRGGNV